MSFNIIRASKNIANKYNRYLKTMFDIKDVEYKKIFERRLEESNFFENELLQMTCRDFCKKA